MVYNWVQTASSALTLGFSMFEVEATSDFKWFHFIMDSWKLFPFIHSVSGCDRQSAFLEQCEVSDDENGEILDETMEARSSNKMLSTDSSSISDNANDSLMEASEVHECAFCRSEVLSLLSFLDNKLSITRVDNDEVSGGARILTWGANLRIWKYPMYN